MNEEKQVLHLNISYVEAINAAYASFNSLEKKIADFILKNGSKCQHMSVREMSETCQCSNASLVRFAKKLNYDGFKDLKYHIRNATFKSQQDGIILSAGEKSSAMIQKALMYAVLSIQNTVHDVDERTLDLAARTIARAPMVQICAMGSASGVAVAACSQFMSFGIRANYYIDELQQLRAAACLKPGDVLIGINYNNSAKSVADAFMAAKKAGATTILITALKSGIIGRYSDFVFYTPKRRPNNALNISTSTLCQSMILQLLILRVWQLNPELFDNESHRIGTYTKMKLYDPSLEKVSMSYTDQI